MEKFLKHFVAYYYGENSSKFKERLLEMEFNTHRKYDDTNLDDEYEKIDNLLFYIYYSSKVWNFLHTLDEKAMTLIFSDHKKLEIEITPNMRVLLDKMRRLNALSDNAFLPLLPSLFTIQLVGKSADEEPYTTKELEGLLD
ncbi:conserved hypothetical protein [Helicobacter acinonychis str. Sheeba]|uniref:Uncharacterized protein n=1 Tax=Helicobacter acinonychis (strain Sheeba) TaxID=382638 RepID=Q17Y51_HELAH|nr:conserved hypothetical protein [Helicobacter acinonychis str. Sheeba]